GGRGGLVLAQARTGGKSGKVLEGAGLTSQSSSEASAGGATAQTRRGARGHGRHGAAAFTDAPRVVIPHANLKPGDPCPACRRGKVYGLPPPVRLVRLRGQSPITATIYELERLRCNLCGDIFTADAPPEAGPDNYDRTPPSVIALLKYPP